MPQHADDAPSIVYADDAGSVVYVDDAASIEYVDDAASIDPTLASFVPTGHRVIKPGMQCRG